MEIYINRTDAALRLMDELEKYRGNDGVVLSIPRGGVPLGYDIARSIDFDLDIAMIKKIGHPKNPELAIGAVSIKDYILSPTGKGVDQTYIEREVERLQEKLRQNHEKFTGEREPSFDLSGKTVIIIDDGIATGSTMEATVKLVKKEDPGRIVIAVPVAPPRTARKFEEMVDEFISPMQPKEFYAVGQFYEHFDQVEDSQVVDLLKRFEKQENK
jgi:putative phosphoribosyl transferase